MRPQTIKMILLLIAALALSVATFVCQKQLSNSNRLIASTEFNWDFPHSYQLAQQVVEPEILFLEVFWNGDEIVLLWDAANELELVGFQIERSENSCEFERIGWVYSRQISRHLFYEFIDKNVISGNEYSYRLKMVEFDGNMAYSTANEAIQVLQ